MRRGLARLLAIALVLAAAGRARGHELDSASLSLVEVEPGRFLVRWHASSATLQDDLATAVAFPAPCRLRGDRLDCGASDLVGTLAFPWIEGTLTRVVVDVEWRNGARVLRVITSGAPSLRLYGGLASDWRALPPIVVDYVRLGVEHILTGFDHLLFVIGVFLLVGRGARLVATITAFTVAHSASLALTVLGVVRVPQAPVEASIALSIVLVCAECLRPRDSLTRRAPWAVAFALGLLHGLGFASALLELGVPEQHLASALLCFNLGVELGQLMVIAIVMAVGGLVTHFRVHKAWARRSLIYAMGVVAASWSIDRIAVIFQALRSLSDGG